MKSLYILAAILLSLLPALPANANIKAMGFKAITHHNAANALTGENQFSLEASDPCSTRITFKFLNTGSTTSTIMNIYFDDHAHLNFASSSPVIDNHGNTQFVVGANPVDLPEGANANPGFVATQTFNAQAKGQSLGKGVNKGDYITISLTLASGKNWQTVSNDLTSGALRVAVYGQNFNGVASASESFVNLPEPATVAILAMGFAALPLTARKTLAR
jgi:hypothetical protein